MPLQTRQNPVNGGLEVLVNERWVCFEDYRREQIDRAYDNSIRFLRDRLGESGTPSVTGENSTVEKTNEETQSQ